MDFGRLDKQDEKTIGATRRAEERILSMWETTVTVVLMIGIAISILVVRAVSQPIDTWICVLAIAMTVLLSVIAYKLITKSIKETKTEFRKLEGFISISTMRLVEEIKKK